MKETERKVKIFCCYTREDINYLEELIKHMGPMKRGGLIDIWNDDSIGPGKEWEKEIRKHLNEAQIILLLISPDFIHSDYCFSTEVKLAVERHEREEATVIPIVLREANWKDIQVGKIKLGALQALPKGAKPITNSLNHDKPWMEVVEEIERVVKELPTGQLVTPNFRDTDFKDPEDLSTIAPAAISSPHHTTTTPIADLGQALPTLPPAKGPDRGRIHILIAGLAVAGLTVLGGGSAWWITHIQPSQIIKPTPTPLPTCAPFKGSIASDGLVTAGVLLWGADPSAGGAPHVFFDANSAPIGFEVDIANAIARLMGINQDCHQTPYKGLEVALREHQIDIILNGWEFTSGREIDEIFSVPYYRYSQQLVVRANDPRFSQYTASSQITLIELKPYKFGTGADYKAADELRAANMILTTSETPIDDLRSKEVDIIMIDAPIVAYYIQGKGAGAALDNTLRAIGKPLFPENYVIGFKKNDPNADTLRREIDKAIFALKQDGTLKRIYQEWGLWNEFQEKIGIVDCV